MILEKNAVTLAEVAEILKDADEKQALKDYVKKFNKISKSDSTKLLAELKELNSIKLREEHMVKIADFLPRDADDLNRLFTELTFSEEEAKAILDIVKNY